MKLNKNPFLVYFLLLSFVSTSVAQNYNHLIPDQYKLRTIVIDAGHGGHDKGAVGYHHQEKDIVLAIANQLTRDLKQQLPDVQILSTRNSDKFLSLKQRAQFANQNQADLFISIHCNAGNKSYSGTEIYTFGKSSTEEMIRVAMRENSSILIENQSNYGSFDPTARVFYDYLPTSNAYTTESQMLARYIEKSMINNRNPNRGVKQAGFVLLKELTMPGVIITSGFITNSNEEKYLASRQAKTELSQSVVSGVKQYKAHLDLQAKKILEQKKAEIARLEKERKRKEAQQAEARRLEKMRQLRQQESAWSWPSVRSLNLKGEQYLVQLLISKEYDETDFPFEKMVMSRIDVIDSYKYLTAPVQRLEDAELIHKKAQKAGFRNAFILKYVDGNIVR